MRPKMFSKSDLQSRGPSGHDMPFDRRPRARMRRQSFDDFRIQRKQTRAFALPQLRRVDDPLHTNRTRRYFLILRTKNRIIFKYMGLWGLKVRGVLVFIGVKVFMGA